MFKVVLVSALTCLLISGYVTPKPENRVVKSTQCNSKIPLGFPNENMEYNLDIKTLTSGDKFITGRLVLGELVRSSYGLASKNSNSAIDETTLIVISSESVVAIESASDTSLSIRFNNKQTFTFPASCTTFTY